MEPLIKGRTKKLYPTGDPETLIMRFGDEATAYDGFTHGTIPGKGIANADITARLMTLLARKGIPTHLIGQAGERELLVRRVNMIPLEVIVRNVAAGSLSRRLRLPVGTALDDTVIEYNYHSDELDDPLVNEYHIAAMKLATQEQMAQIADMAARVNTVLCAAFDRAGIQLVDFKLEFGTDAAGKLLLADEISPDTCRLWDDARHVRLDKDVFSHEHDGSEKVYFEVLCRLTECNA